MSESPPIPIYLPLADIQTFCEDHAVRRLSLFGSILREDFTADSDVDLLVEYLPDAKTTLIDMAQHEIALTEIVGRKVDLRTANELSRYFRNQVTAEAVSIYERD